jgi:putative transposase
VEEERLRFVARLLDGETMTRLCAEFGISRKTGYKIFDRYKDVGVQGLADRSRRPYRHANQLPLLIETTIVRLKREYPHGGAPKIRERLRRRCPDVQCPAISTVHAVLDRHGLVTRRKRRRYRAEGTALSQATQPNDLWCADCNPPDRSPRASAGVEHLADGGNDATPLALFGGELPAAVGSQRIALHPAGLLGRPFAGNPALLLEPMQRRKQRARLHAEGPAGQLTDAIGNGNTMERSQLQGPQYEQIERATQQISLVASLRHRVI